MVKFFYENQMFIKLCKHFQQFSNFNKSLKKILWKKKYLNCVGELTSPLKALINYQK